MNIERLDHIDSFQHKLGGTIAWCTSQDWSANPAEGLRTPLFRLSEYRLKGHYDDIFLHQTPSQRQQFVEQIAQARAALLEKRGGSRLSLETLVRRGRLLAFTPDGTLQDGAANLATDGFFDEDNIPPWGTWIWYVTNDPVRKPEL